MASYIALNYWELAAASIFVVINAGLSVMFGLKVHLSLLVAAIRMVVQLTLVGLVLTTLFSVVSPLWTGITALAMVLFAGHDDRVNSGWGASGRGGQAPDIRYVPHCRGYGLGGGNGGARWHLPPHRRAAPPSSRSLDRGDGRLIE